MSKKYIFEQRGFEKRQFKIFREQNTIIVKNTTESNYNLKCQFDLEGMVIITVQIWFTSGSSLPTFLYW